MIVEEFIEKQGCSSDSDSFSLDGGLVFTSFSAQRFDRDATNEYVPAAYSWPSTFTDDQEAYLKSELQRLLTLLHMQTSVYNIETRIGTNGKQYIMEVSPRGGGNRLAEMARMGTGVDIITACVRAAVGDSVPTIEQKTFDGHWAEVILHSEKTGKFKQLNISPEVVPYIKQTDLWVKPGDTVNTFRGANDTIGTLVMRFDTEKKLLDAMDGVNSWCKVETD